MIQININDIVVLKNRIYRVEWSKWNNGAKQGNRAILKLLNNKGGYHMFTGLKRQLELSDILINDIVPKDNELVKLTFYVR